jgi:hypothetical protein
MKRLWIGLLLLQLIGMCHALVPSHERIRLFSLNGKALSCKS